MLILWTLGGVQRLNRIPDHRVQFLHPCDLLDIFHCVDNSFLSLTDKPVTLV